MSLISLLLAGNTLRNFRISWNLPLMIWETTLKAEVFLARKSFIKDIPGFGQGVNSVILEDNKIVQKVKKRIVCA
jgi:hypothetical protein